MILRLRRAWAYLVFSHRRHCERSVWQIWQWRTQETIVYLLMLLLFCNMVRFECTWFILKKHTMFGTFTSYMVHSLRPFALFSSIFSIQRREVSARNWTLHGSTNPFLLAPDPQAPWFLQWKHKTEHHLLRIQQIAGISLESGSQKWYCSWRETCTDVKRRRNKSPSLRLNHFQACLLPARKNSQKPHHA